MTHCANSASFTHFLHSSYKVIIPSSVNNFIIISLLAFYAQRIFNITPLLFKVSLPFLNKPILIRSYLFLKLGLIITSFTEMNQKTFASSILF